MTSEHRGRLGATNLDACTATAAAMKTTTRHDVRASHVRLHPNLLLPQTCQFRACRLRRGTSECLAKSSLYEGPSAGRKKTRDPLVQAPAWPVAGPGLDGGLFRVFFRCARKEASPTREGPVLKLEQVLLDWPRLQQVQPQCQQNTAAPISHTRASIINITIIISITNNVCIIAIIIIIIIIIIMISSSSSSSSSTSSGSSNEGLFCFSSAAGRRPRTLEKDVVETAST